MRVNLFEFEDIKGFPNELRNGMTDYLRYVLIGLKIYEPVVPLLNKLLKLSKKARIVDLCSGGGGAIETIYQLLTNDNPELEIVLTDLYTNVDSYELIKSRSAGRITFHPLPVDAASVPSHLTGIRTMFSAFHHFSPKMAKGILKDAIDRKEPIAIFDGGEKNLVMILLIILLHPFLFFFLSPFIKPFKLSRMVLIYLFPLIPLCTIWDGVVSILRLYTPAQMKSMASEIGKGAYYWESGTVKGKLGFKVFYLIGLPISDVQK